uniref:Uncharacterized protein n=1 Tax=Romanomermis culicivorax TaxID=13658 RepID=A0A915JYU6_ROMCU
QSYGQLSDEIVTTSEGGKFTVDIPKFQSLNDEKLTGIMIYMNDWENSCSEDEQMTKFQIENDIDQNVGTHFLSIE